MRGGLAIERCGAELLSRLLPEGTVLKGQAFRYFVRSKPCTKRVVTAKPRRLDATPAEHNRGGSHTSPTIDVLSSPEHLLLNLEAADYPRFSCQIWTSATPNFIFFRD